MPTTEERIAALESAVVALQQGMAAQQQIAAAFIPATPQQVMIGAPVFYRQPELGATPECWSTARVVEIGAPDGNGVPAVKLVTDRVFGRGAALRVIDDVPHGQNTGCWALPTEI